MLKRLMLSLMFAAGLILLAPAPQAEASDWGWHSSNVRYSWWSWRSWGSWGDKDCDDGGHNGVPELDASTAGSAMVLLIGGVAYIASRRRDEEDA